MRANHYTRPRYEQSGRSRRTVTIYEVGLVSLCIYWFLHRTSALSRLTPRLTLGNVDYGIYLVAMVIFSIVFAMLVFFERNLGTPTWIAGIRSHQGTSRYVDILILIVAFAISAVTFGSRLLDSEPFLVIILLIASGAATQSLLAGYESSRPPIEGAIEAPAEETWDALESDDEGGISNSGDLDSAMTDLGESVLEETTT